MEKEKNTNPKKKRHLKWQIKFSITIIFIIVFTYIIGTKGLFIKEYTIKTDKIEYSMNGLKIMQFSDIHFNSNTNKNKIKNLVKNINKTKPDIVIFSGDLIDKEYNISEDEKSFLKKELLKITAELGKYYVTGEDDTELNIQILNSASFINLDNSKELVYKNSKIPIMLIGKNICADEIKNENNNILKILLLHNPNDFNKFKDSNIDITLCGHTHNGTINIPKIKELFIDGKYYKTYQKVNNTRLYINPGIGTGKINIRIFNHPTINLYRISSKKNN